MGGWRLPIGVSLALHGAIGASLLVAPRSEVKPPRSEPVQIEIVHYEAKPIEEKTIEEPTVPIEPKTAPVEEKKEKRKREPKKAIATPEPAPPIGRDDEEDEKQGEAGGGGAIAEGGGPVVGGGGSGTGKTKDGRDLSSLDLSPRLSVPRFEDQGPGVVIEPPKDPKRRPTSDGGWTYDDTTFGARVARDGSVTFDGRGHSDVDGIPDFAINPGSETEAPSGGAKWTLDVNDWILSAAGDDPYSYEKRKFLEATREERLAMARAACGERLSASLAELPARLDKIWKSNQPPEEKREVLFDLWDDCAEEGSPEVRRYGELARLTILDFIQKHLPEGSPDAYTELEIDRLNQRRVSSRRFAPYRGRM